ncbi:uncharacterized protein LOC117177736 [Belonocnema kinseyi]|uniref:uncharacterized protein LOC117177736 n=1 Tax=Belonocnema kinseyi TaxID=2817044 RepID=UPI00143DE845|nr:uncharacterized protein LOC117177736 [Belonocnema kinseyi]
MTNSNTTGINKHMQRFHRKEYIEAFPTCNQQNVGRTENDFVPNEFTRMVVEWLSVNHSYIPFSFFDGKLTQRLFKYLNPSAIFHKRTASRAHVLCTFNKMKKVIKKIIEEQKSKFSFTIDIRR